MKIILNDDVKHLGEMGDVKTVANGYARNYLFPHGFAVPYTPESVAYFEGKKAEIEARKEQKRADSKSLKEKLESQDVVLTMPAGSNGKLYGAVTSQTLVDYYSKLGYEIERKRIEIPGLTIKSCGSYTVKVHLYEAALAEVKLSVQAQPTNEDSGKKEEKPRKSKSESAEKKSENKEAEASAENN
ncbi:MAG: 50S ribosomal protein L9 [Treponema sp.]|nr:50S ribosomal protein L9 [Treponema sp.]